VIVLMNENENCCFYFTLTLNFHFLFDSQLKKFVQCYLHHEIWFKKNDLKHNFWIGLVSCDFCC
jgi:hypothetical protein